MTAATSTILKGPIRKIIRFGTGKRMPKFRNRSITIDGHKFPSRREGRRYLQLKLLQSNGELRDLKLQVEYRCDVNGQHICKYRADFTYSEYRGGKWLEICEDVKGYQTPEYRLKRKLMLACHGIEIRET